ncbi:MAG: right-handed parallel beta-helix repeat-containing protein [Planctomycetia bacterium]|nr:right-handed parallel beta-helix repeat-containing protein [Planctomycetia bacterium]
MSAFLLVSAVANAQDRSATVNVRTREELEQAVAEARPGTTIAIAPGTYEGGLAFSRLQGTQDRPIVLAAADRMRPPIISGGNSCLHLSDPAYVELRDLVLEKGRANGLNIDDGDSHDTPAHHVSLHGLTVRDIGSDRNHDGIKLSGLDDFRVERCTVERWGKRGSAIDMVGCHRGIVTHGTFRDGDPIGANGVQMKGGSRDVTVRYCRFENAGGRAVNLGGSTGLPYFRPAQAGYEAKDLIVEDCMFVGSMAPVAFVGVDGATVRHNTFFRPSRWLIRILQENQDSKFLTCRNGSFMKNIVAFRSEELVSAVNIGPRTAPETFRFTDNFWYCLDAPETTQRRVQLPTAESGGVYDQAPGFRNEAKKDLQLIADSPASGFGPRIDSTLPTDAARNTNDRR